MNHSCAPNSPAQATGAPVRAPFLSEWPVDRFSSAGSASGAASSSLALLATYLHRANRQSLPRLAARETLVTNPRWTRAGASSIIGLYDTQPGPQPLVALKCLTNMTRQQMRASPMMRRSRPSGCGETRIGRRR